MKNYLLKKIEKYLILIFLFYFLLLVQENFLNNFIISRFPLNIYLISLFLLIFFGKGNFGIESAVLAGIILDLFSFYPFGVFTFSLVFTSFLVGRIYQIFQKSNVLANLLLLVLFLSFYKIFLIFGNFFFNLILDKI